MKINTTGKENSKNPDSRDCEVMLISHGAMARLLTQQVGPFVHVSDHVVSCRRQFLEQRVGVPVKGEVLYAAFSWCAG